MVMEKLFKNNTAIRKDLGFLSIIFAQFVLFFMIGTLYMTLPSMYGEWRLTTTYELNWLYYLSFIALSVYISSLGESFQETLARPTTWAYILSLMALSFYLQFDEIGYYRSDWFNPLLPSVVIFFQGLVYVRKLGFGESYPIKLRLSNFDYYGRPILLAASVYCIYFLADLLWQGLEEYRISAAGDGAEIIPLILTTPTRFTP